MRGRELSPRYIELCASAVRLYIETYPAFKRTRVSEATAGLFEKWMLWMQDQGHGPRTTNTALQAARVGIRRWAKVRRAADPLEGLQKAAEVHQTRGSLSLAEIKAVLACRSYKVKLGKGRKEESRPVDPRVRAGVMLAILAGLRMGECRGLDWIDVNKDDGILKVRQSIPVGERAPRKPKWGSVGEVPAQQLLLDELDEPAAGSPFGRGGYVLYSQGAGKPVGSETLANGFRRMLSAIGIPPEQQRARRLSFHSCRHAYVSLGRFAGLPDFLVQRYAQHKTPMMTEEYSHANILDIEEARRKLGRAVAPPKARTGATA